MSQTVVGTPATDGSAYMAHLTWCLMNCKSGFSIWATATATNTADLPEAYRVELYRSMSITANGRSKRAASENPFVSRSIVAGMPAKGKPVELEYRFDDANEAMRFKLQLV